MDNTIYTNLDSTIGYYKDIKDGYKDLIQDAIEKDDYEAHSVLLCIQTGKTLEGILNSILI